VSQKGAEVDEHGHSESELFEDYQEKMQNLILVYKFLQLLCEGHNQSQQDYLREQKQNDIVNGRTVDFIRLTAQNFGSYIKFVNINCLELGEVMIDFLIEALQGPCQLNQLKLARNKIVDFVKDFIVLFPKQDDYKRRGFKTNEERNEINAVMTKSTLLLKYLLEGNESSEILV
jgi:hypothetical protein